MQTTIKLDVLEHFECLEPKVGAELLLLYPEFLTPEECERFELHLQSCEHCQERWKLWRATGLAVRIEAILQRANALLDEHRYEDAVAEYNRAARLAPALEQGIGKSFWEHTAWTLPSAATSHGADILPFLSTAYAPDAYQMAASVQRLSPFPVDLKYEDEQGTVNGKITSRGRQVFVTIEASGDYAAGMKLLARVFHAPKESNADAPPVPTFQWWEITPGQTQRLGTIETLFGSQEPDVLKWLNTFRVIPA
jgi:tetratricopeptide (TPR) repeat protein